MRYARGMAQANRMVDSGRPFPAFQAPRFIGAGLLIACMTLFACEGGKKGDHKPTGSPTDPVDVCERPAQVCQYKGSQLGVCISKQKTDPSCEGQFPCFACVPQH